MAGDKVATKERKKHDDEAFGEIETEQPAILGDNTLSPVKLERQHT